MTVNKYQGEYMGRMMRGYVIDKIKFIFEQERMTDVY